MSSSCSTGCRERARLAAEGLFDLVGFGFVSILDYAMINYVLSTFQRGMRAPTLLATPLYLPQAVMPIGVTLLAFALLASAADKLGRAWRIGDGTGGA